MLLSDISVWSSTTLPELWLPQNGSVPMWHTDYSQWVTNLQISDGYVCKAPVHRISVFHSNLSMGKTKELLRDGKDKVVDLHLVWDWSCERLQMIPKRILWIVKELKAIRTTVPMHTIDNTLHYNE